MRRRFPALTLLVAACSSSPPSPPPRLTAPTSFAAVIDVAPSLLTLRWEQVPGATGYLVFFSAPGYQDTPVEVVGTAGVFHWNSALPAGLTLSVVARRKLEYSPRSNSIPFTTGGFTLKAGNRAAHLHWDAASLPNAIITRMSPTGETVVLRAMGGEFDDTELAPGLAYVWSMNLNGPALEVLPQSLSDYTAPPAPGGLTVQYSDYDLNAFFLEWAPSPGAHTYLVRTAAGVTPVSSLSLTNNCDGALSCSFQVAGVTSNGAIGDFSAPLAVTAVPPAPAPPTVVSGIAQVAVTLPALPPNTDHFVLEQTTRTGTSWARVASAVQGSVVVPTPAWAEAFFRVRAVTADGILSTPSQNAYVVVTGPPDSANLAGAASGSDETEGQRITVQRGGRLLAVEVGVLSSGPLFAVTILSRGKSFSNGLHVTPASWTGSLSADFETGTVIDLYSPVSAGETIDVVVRDATVALSDAAGTGRHLKHGSPDPAHDLVYKLFVQPDDRIFSPAVVEVWTGLSAARVSWTASPAAIRYDVYGADDGAASVLRGSTHERWFEDPIPLGSNRTYSVTAVGGTSSASATAGFSVRIGSVVSAAENLGDAPAAQASLCAGEVRSQTFVSAVNGTLDGLELRVDGTSGTFTLELRDGQGKLLASVPKQLATDPEQLLPLDTIVMGPGYVDFSSFGIVMHTGDSFELSASMQPMYAGACTTLRDTTDVYAGGVEKLNGVAIPDRDLAFRVIAH